MNLVNSKVIKSSRPIINRSIETVTAYSCELFIDSFKISHRGFVYFLWTSNNSQIHSLRYESIGKLMQVKETLTISLRITSKNGRDLPSITYLKLITDTGEELDEFELPMNCLTSQFKEMEIPMDRGLINIKIRRKVMNIGEEEEINFQGGFYRSMAHRNDEKSLANMVSGEYQSLQEELSRTKKQLEDAVYLNNKLKNDRDVLLATKQELELEIETMIIQITKEISVLREHYDNRMSIREHCYEEEIQDLVNLFNSNAEQSKKTLEVIIKQKIKLEEEMRPMTEKLKNLQIQIANKNADCSRLSEEKIQIQIRLSQVEELSAEKEREIESLIQGKGKLQQEINSQNLHIEHLQGQISNKNEAITRLQGSINDLERRIGDDELLLHQKDEHIFELEGKMIQLQQRDKANGSEKELFHKQISLLEQEKKGFLAQIEALNGRLEQFEYEMQFNENVMGQLKKQQTQKEEELYSQLESLEKLYSQKMEDIINNFQREKDQLLFLNQTLEQEKQQLVQKIHELENNIKGSELKLTEMDHQLNNLSNQIRNTQGSAGEKDQTIRRLMKQIEKLNAEMEGMKVPSLDKKKSQKRIEVMEVGGKNQDLEKTYQAQIQKNQALQAQIKRLSALLDKNSKEMEKIKQQKHLMQEQMQKKVEEKSYKSLKHSKHRSEPQLDAFLKNGTINQEEVKEIVHAKQREISELRHRVEYLENLYEGLQAKFDQIAKKYPQIDLGVLPVPKPQQWCDSEQEEERILNNALQNNGNNNPDVTSLKHTNKFSRKDSIGAAILEKDEDALSNPSAKYNTERRSLEPRSEQRIGDGYRRGIIRKQSVAGRVTIEVPRGSSIRRDNSHGSYDASERSGSYVKVSHSKKIKELEDEVKALLEKVKGYEAQIDDYLKSIDSLKKELQATKHMQAIEKKPVQQVKKESKESQVFFEDERVKNFMQESQLKEFEVQKMHLRLGELQDVLKNQKAQGLKKVNALQLKITQFEKRIDEGNRRYDGLLEVNKNLQKLNEQLQQKLRKQKQTAQEARLSVKQVQMHLDNAQNQLKKLKALNETLEDKIKKLIGSQAVIKQLSRELDDMNKKALDQTRVINHLKLQKDAVDEQMRLLKKRQNDYIRISTEWEEKAASLQRALEEQKRKEGKFKRQIDEIQEQLRRSKLNTKKVEQQLQSLNSSQMAWQGERRKHLDQISSLQDQLSRKDYEFTKLTKQIQKWKARAQQKEQFRMGKKSELRQEIDRLQSQLIRKQKKLLEQTEQNKLLRGRLQLLERENKRIMEQKNQSYGQKLKYYVEEMSNIKKLLEEYQNQNSRLKIDNNELYEQLEILRMNYDKLQMKYDQNIEREESILNDLQSYINEVNVLKDRLGQAHNQLDQAEAAFVSIRKEVDEEKLQSRRVAQKLQTSERNLERAMVQIRDLKIKISEYETNNQINGKMGERYRLLERKKGQLEDQYRKIKSEYDNIVNVFVYKREDLEKAVAEARAQEKRLKDEQVQKINEQCSKMITSKTQRLQQEILDVYNENSRLRAQNQSLMQQNGRLKGKLSQLQMIADRFGSLQNQNDNYRYSIDELKQQLRKKNEKISKMDISIQAIEAQCNTKERDIFSCKNRIQELQKNIEKLNNQISARRATERQLQDAILKNGQSKERQRSQQQFMYKQRQAQLVQQYESKIHSFEAQIQRLKQKEAKNIQENASKMKKLEEKMDQMEEALKEREKAIQSNYQNDMQQLQNSLLRLSQELQQKIIRIDELNEGILILQDENKDLTKQIQDLKFQFEQQRQILDGELTRLKNKLKQAESTYAANLKSLEQEVLRNAQKANISGSRVKTNETEDRIAKRYEDKLKNKDRKIEELKENIYALEETIVKLRKKESGYQATLSEVERLKISIVQFEKQRKNIETKYEEELSRNTDTIRELKREILLTKESEDRLRLLAEQKVFQNESISSQLKTMRELYQELQRQLQKRKNTLTAQLEEQNSIQMQLRTRESKILQLEERLMETLKCNKQFEIDVKRKTSEIKKYIEMINEFQKKQQKYVQDIAKLTNQLAFAKKSSQELNSASELSKSEVMKMRNELTRLRKNQQELRATCLSKEQTANQLKRLYDDLASRYKEAEELSQKYTIINQRSRQQLGYGIQEIVDRFLMHLEEKDAEMNQLVEEVEQLKFLNERKYLDYDELKKENFQLQIKVEDLDILNDQLETLRKICDKLEEQKKNSVFREEVLRMQLENLANAGAPDLRSRIQAILSNPTVPSYTNFSFYNM